MKLKKMTIKCTQAKSTLYPILISLSKYYALLSKIGGKYLLTIDFATAEGGSDMNIRWDNTEVKVPIRL